MLHKLKYLLGSDKLSQRGRNGSCNHLTSAVSHLRNSQIIKLCRQNFIFGKNFDTLLLVTAETNSPENNCKDNNENHESQGTVESLLYNRIKSKHC